MVMGVLFVTSKTKSFSFRARNSASDNLLVGSSYLASPPTTPLKVIVLMGIVELLLLSIELDLPPDLALLDKEVRYLPPAYPLRLASPRMIS